MLQLSTSTGLDTPYCLEEATAAQPSATYEGLTPFLVDEEHGGQCPRCGMRAWYLGAHLMHRCPVQTGRWVKEMVEIEKVIRKRMRCGMVSRRMWMGLTIDAAVGRARIQWVKPWRRHLVPANTWPMYLGSVLTTEDVELLAAVLPQDVRLLIVECMRVLDQIQLSVSAAEQLWQPTGVYDHESLGSWNPGDDLPTKHPSVSVPVAVAHWALMTTHYWILDTTWGVPMGWTPGMGTSPSEVCSPTLRPSLGVARHGKWRSYEGWQQRGRNAGREERWGSWSS